MTISRREFGKGALGLGLALGAARFLSACSPDKKETKTLHFDLSHLPAGDKHTLRSGGRRYQLVAHTDSSRKAAIAARPALDKYPQDHITHYADNVLLSTVKTQRFHVTTKSARGDGLVLASVHIPTDARVAAKMQTLRHVEARRACGKLTPFDDPQPVCTIMDEAADDFVTGFHTAKAILWHHPEIMAIDPTIAAAVEAHMDASADVLNLAMSICTQGPAWMHEEAYFDGWCVLVPLNNSDGTPKLDDQGDQLYDYEFSDQTKIDMKPAINDVLQAVKNDPALAGQMYQVNYDGAPVTNMGAPTSDPYGDFMSSSAGINPRRTPVVPRQTTSAAATLDRSGYHHNIAWLSPSLDTTGGSISITIINMSFIWYGIYLQYLGPDGNNIDSGTSSPLAQAIDGVLVAAALAAIPPAPPFSCESTSARLQTILSPPATVFGIPIAPQPVTLTMSLPAGASTVRIMLGGPGQPTTLPYDGMLTIGILLTIIVQYAIPMYFLLAGTGLDETKTLEELFKSPKIIIAALSGLINLVIDLITPDLAHGMAIAGSFANLITGILNKLVSVGVSSVAPEVAEWIAEKLTELEIFGSIPFVGWITRIVANAGGIADIIATSAEIGTVPSLVDNRIMLTQPVTVTINHDPANDGFPAVATSYEISVYAGTTPISQTFTLAAADRNNGTVTSTVNGVPVTGVNATVQVDFYAATGWLAATSSVTGTDNLPTAGRVTFSNAFVAGGSGPTVTVTLEENPVPITSATTYSHLRKLGYSGSSYQWVETTTPPALQVNACATTQSLCEQNNVSLWLPGGMLGYSWRAASSGIIDCHGSGGGQLYTFQTVSLRNDPNVGRKSPSCGFQGPAPVAFDPHGNADGTGLHLWLDAVSIDVNNPQYVVRGMTLDSTNNLMIPSTQAWGRFRIPLDRLAIRRGSDKNYVVGLSTANSKLAFLELPSAAFADNSGNFVYDAVTVSGPGDHNDRLLFAPISLSVAQSGAIVVLDGAATRRLKAFAVDGSPALYFKNKTVSQVPLMVETGITYLDVSVTQDDLVYVLSFSGDGSQTSQYRLDVYDNNGAMVVRQTGIAVSRIAIDAFHTMYSSNRELMSGSPRIEPTTSVWNPLDAELN